MNRHESLSERLKYHRQENELKEKQRSAILHQNYIDKEEQKRVEENQKRKEITQRVKETKEIFKSTGIIESFQDIINNGYLSFALIGSDGYRRSFFGTRIQTETQRKIPAKIDYRLNEVALLYDAELISISDGYDGSYSHYEYKEIRVIKDEKDKYKLILPSGRLNSDRPITFEETIDQIACFIASRGEHPIDEYKHTFLHFNGELLKFSKACDYHNGIFSE